MVGEGGGVEEEDGTLCPWSEPREGPRCLVGDASLPTTITCRLKHLNVNLHSLHLGSRNRTCLKFVLCNIC